MSQYPPIRPWATLNAIDQDHKSEILDEDERQQWFQQHPHVDLHIAKRIGNKSQRAFAERGPSMAEGLRGIAERGAARRNGTAVNKNDVFTKPLPPIPQQEAPQPATAVGQEGVSQGSGHDINKMSIYYVLDRSNMQGHHETSLAQREDSQPATEVDEKSVVDGSVHSSEKMKPNLLLEECKLQGYDDETPSIQPDGSKPALPSFLYHYCNAQASYATRSSAVHSLAQATQCATPAFEAPNVQANPSPHRNGYSPTSWYEALPTGHESSPDAQVPVAPSATPVPEIRQNNQFTDVGATIDELLALIDKEKESYRLANENHNPGSSSSAYRLAPPNSASTNIYHADQRSSPVFASPGKIREITPATPAWWSPSPVSSPSPKGCCHWSSDEFEPGTTASPEPQFDREWSASDVSMEESPALTSSPPNIASLQGDFTWRSDNPDEVETGFTVPLGRMYARDCTTPDSPLLDSPSSPTPALPSTERPPSDLRGFSYADAPRVGIYPSQIPKAPQPTQLISLPDYILSPSSYPRWLKEYRAHMENVEQSPVSPQLNVTEKKTTFTMDVPIHEVSQHQTAVHVSESTNGGHSRAASFVSNTPSNVTLSRVTQSPDSYSSDGSEDSRGTKRKRFTKNLFGKKGYLEDNEGPRDKRFRFLKEAIEKGHSTIGSIKGMFWDEDRALINSSKPSIVTENTAPITLNTDVQSILYAEIENMITHAANEFLMKEYYEGHLTISSLNKIKRRWEKKHMPGVPQFRFDQTTQYRLISANRDHLNFGQTSNGLKPNTVLSNWKKICKNMSIRTFVAPDSVIKKQIHDILDLLEILKADECHIELIMALSAHVRGELKKHEVMQHYRDTQNSGNSRS